MGLQIYHKQWSLNIKRVLGCAVCVYVYLTLKKIFMRSIYMTKYHWNVKPDNVMKQIMMIVYPL